MTDSRHILNQDCVAALAGVSARRIRQLEKEDKGPARLPDGGYDAETIGRWLRQRVLDEIGIADDGEAYDYNAERARLTKHEADIAEMKSAELRGLLIRAEAVKACWQGVIGAARSRLMGLPVKVAAAVAGPGEMDRATDAAMEVVRDALTELAASDGIPDEIRARIAAIAAGREPGGLDAAAADDSQPVG